MGKVYKRGSKYYIDYFNEKGERKRKVAGNTKKQAEEILARLEAKKYSEKFGIKYQEDKLTEEIFELFENLKERQVRPASIMKYRKHLDFWAKKHREIFKPLSIPEIENHLHGLAKDGLSNATINSYLITLKSLYNYAEKRKFLKENTAAQVKGFKDKARKPPRFFTEEEIEKILSYDTPYKDIFIILLYTGMRRDELRLLEWHDIDFKNREINIKNKKGFTTKSGENRTIPIHPKIYDILKRLKQDSGYIFSYSTGNPHHRNKWNDSLQRILKKEGIESGSIHTFRHTFANRFLQAGGSLRELQELLGHADYSTTLIYAHLTPKHLKDAVNRLK